MSSVISVDSGSSYMKMYDGEHKIRFPAIVQERQPAELIGKEIRVESRYFLVGDTARTAVAIAIPVPLIDPGFHGSIIQYVQMCYAFEQLKIHGERDILVTSLPYTDSRNKDLKKKIKSRKTFIWSVIDEDDVEHDRKLTFNNIKIVAQGIGAIKKFHTKHKEKSPKVIMLCDIGACTTDIITIKKNYATGDYDYCFDACTSIENFNVAWFKEKWIDNLYHEVRGIRTDKEFDYYTIMQHAIDSDFQMQLGDRKIDAEPSFNATRSDFALLLKPALKKAVKDIWYDIEQIIFTGGGSHLVNFTSFEDQRIAKMDQWANAEGQYEMFSKASQPAVPVHATTSIQHAPKEVSSVS